MKNLSAGKCVGIVAILVGLLWLGGISLVPVGLLCDEHPLVHIVFAISITSFFWIPAAFCLYFGIRLVRKTTKQSVKGAVGALSVMAVMVLGLVIHQLMAIWTSEKTDANMDMLVATVLVIPFYAISCRAILKREGIPTQGYREFISKTVIALVALQIWAVASGLLVNYDFPGHMVGASGVAVPLLLLLGLSPILLAWAFFRLTVWFVEPRQHREPNAVQFRR